MGTSLDIPLGHKDAAFVRSHFDGMEVQINDAPRSNEIMVAVEITTRGFRKLLCRGKMDIAVAQVVGRAGEDAVVLRRLPMRGGADFINRAHVAFCRLCGPDRRPRASFASYAGKAIANGSGSGP